MLQFRCMPEVYKYKTFERFVEEIKISNDDLIITVEFLYDKLFNSKKIDCNFIIQDHYGLGEPTEKMVVEILKECQSYNYNRVIAIGGGTVIDIGKLLIIKDININSDLYTMFLTKENIVKDKELIIIPTTCGTGSEVTNISIVNFEEKNTKLGLAVDEIFADKAVIVEALFETLPYYTFVTSSIDALIHGIESYLSPKSNIYTEVFSEKAIKIILNGYLRVIDKGEGEVSTVAKEFAVASNFAGIAFSNTGVGAVHAISYPLSGKYHVPHGEANYIFLTTVLKKYYVMKCNGKIKELNKIFREALNSKMDGIALYDELDALLGALLPKKNLHSFGMKKWEGKEFAKSVLKSQQRLLQNNYVPLNEEDIEGIYKELL